MLKVHTHSPPKGCLAVTVGGVFHMLSCRSSSYGTTAHSSAPMRSEDSRRYKEICHNQTSQ